MNIVDSDILENDTTFQLRFSVSHLNNPTVYKVMKHTVIKMSLNVCWDNISCLYNFYDTYYINIFVIALMIAEESNRQHSQLQITDDKYYDLGSLCSNLILKTLHTSECLGL